LGNISEFLITLHSIVSKVEEERWKKEGKFCAKIFVREEGENKIQLVKGRSHP
jgi:hypothetical protein